MNHLTREEYEAKSREHHRLMNRYLRLMHTRLGQLWEIPECCIKQFVDETLLGIPVALYRQNKHRKEIPVYIQYVPCDNCMKNL